MQLAAAVKARQICEQRLESIVVVQGDAGKEDLIAEAINKLQPQRHDLEQLQTCIDELELKRNNLSRNGRVLDKMFAGMYFSSSLKFDILVPKARYVSTCFKGPLVVLFTPREHTVIFVTSSFS